jgi:hypothetical protein
MSLLLNSRVSTFFLQNQSPVNLLSCILVKYGIYLSSSAVKRELTCKSFLHSRRALVAISQQVVRNPTQKHTHTSCSWVNIGIFWDGLYLDGGLYVSFIVTFETVFENWTCSFLKWEAFSRLSIRLHGASLLCVRCLRAAVQSLLSILEQQMPSSRPSGRWLEGNYTPI